MTQDMTTYAANTLHCLPAQTVLKERYRLLSVAAFDSGGITYRAEDVTDGAQLRIRECFPRHLAERDGTALSSEQPGELEQLQERFRAAAQLLEQHAVRHLPALTEWFPENGTLYCVFPWTEGTSLEDTQLVLTPTYLRSLGLELCECYADLLGGGCSYGVLTASDIVFDGQGHMSLNPDRLLDPFLPVEPDPAGELHRLTAFLNGCLSRQDDQWESSPELQQLREALSYTYPDVPSLYRSLLCVSGTVKPPASGRCSRRTAVLCLFCLLVLAAAVILSVQICRRPRSLASLVAGEAVTPDVISVWVPLEEDADEQQVMEMYQRLTSGFEKKYPGFGIQLMLFADGSFGEALAAEENSLPQPAVLMDTDAPEVLALAADLSQLTNSLEDCYLADMTGFSVSLPLGCSLPAVYYHTYAGEAPEASVIAAESLPADVLCDASAAAWLAESGLPFREGAFSEFLKDGSKPILASTACLSQVQQQPEASGAVRMLPVTAEGTSPLLYEMPCSVNANADRNSRLIGMLWLQYLLTEEAQTILFAENGAVGILPLHRDAFAYTVEQHSDLAVIGELTDALAGASR